MNKKQGFILWGLVGAVVVWLLWRNRAKVAPQVFNTPSPTYLDMAYPQVQVTAPPLQAPISGASCGCNPAASQYLSGVASSINQAEQQIEQQLKNYTDSINEYFATKVIQ